MQINITIITTIILTILFIFLSVRTIMHRAKTKISLGHGEDQEMLRRVRSHANFSEYVPISLFILFLNEIMQTNFYVLVLISLCMILGRYVHIYALYSEKIKMNARVFGMAMTFTGLGIGLIFLVLALLK
jgi:uncharacterized protein